MIKPFHLRDTQLVLRLQRAGIALDVEEQLTHPRSPLRSALLDIIPSLRIGPSTFIFDHYDDKGRHSGLAQTRVRPGRLERDIVFMSPALDTGNGSHAIWQRLLTHLCIQMAERGCLRVYAHLPPQSEEFQVFKNVGFMAYTETDIYQLNPNVNRLQLKAGLQLRPQQANDSWRLQKLYTAITPRSIQNIEGLGQGQWDLTRSWWAEQGRRKGYVWEIDGEIVGALHIRLGKCGYWLKTMLHPAMLEQAADLCRAALQFTTAKAHLPVYFTFRQYESGWRHTLPELGFEPLAGQTLVVKPMTVRVREKAPGIIPTLEGAPPEGAASIVSQVET